MFKIVNKRSLNPTVTLMDIEAPLVAKKAETVSAYRLPLQASTVKREP